MENVSYHGQLTLFTLPTILSFGSAVYSYRLASIKGRNSIPWFILGLIPIVNLWSTMHIAASKGIFHAAGMTDDLESTGRHKLPEYSIEKLDELFSCSSIIMYLCGLWSIGLILDTALLVLGHQGLLNLSDGQNYMLITSVVLMLASVLGGVIRDPVGRLAGIVTCTAMLPGIPIGTFLGLGGLAAYSSAKPLFGDDAIPHRVLKQELLYRRNNGIS